jgi:hypothetical protein
MLTPWQSLAAGAGVLLAIGIQSAPRERLTSWTLSTTESLVTTETLRRPTESAMTRTLVASRTKPVEEEARIRARVLRVRSDMRQMASAIETYQFDQRDGAYPLCTTDTLYSTVRGMRELEPVPGFYRGGNDLGIANLQQPIPYATRSFSDPFAPTGNQSYGYYSTERQSKHGWILFSPGPDSVYELDWTRYDPVSLHPARDLARYTYDPTNGARSSGDIWFSRR